MWVRTSIVTIFDHLFPQEARGQNRPITVVVATHRRRQIVDHCSRAVGGRSQTTLGQLMPINADGADWVNDYTASRTTSGRFLSSLLRIANDRTVDGHQPRHRRLSDGNAKSWPVGRRWAGGTISVTLCRTSSKTLERHGN